MYTQALNSGGGVAQRLNQHFYTPSAGLNAGLLSLPFAGSPAEGFFWLKGVDKIGRAPAPPAY